MGLGQGADGEIRPFYLDVPISKLKGWLQLGKEKESDVVPDPPRPPPNRKDLYYQNRQVGELRSWDELSEEEQEHWAAEVKAKQTEYEVAKREWYAQCLNLLVCWFWSRKPRRDIHLFIQCAYAHKGFQTELERVSKMNGQVSVPWLSAMLVRVFHRLPEEERDYFRQAADEDGRLHQQYHGKLEAISRRIYENCTVRPRKGLVDSVLRDEVCRGLIRSMETLVDDLRLSQAILDRLLESLRNLSVETWEGGRRGRRGRGHKRGRAERTGDGMARGGPDTVATKRARVARLRSQLGLPEQQQQAEEEGEGEEEEEQAGPAHRPWRACRGPQPACHPPRTPVEQMQEQQDGGEQEQEGPGQVSMLQQACNGHAAQQMMEQEQQHAGSSAAEAQVRGLPHPSLRVQQGPAIATQSPGPELGAMGMAGGVASGLQRGKEGQRMSKAKQRKRQVQQGRPPAGGNKAATPGNCAGSMAPGPKGAASPAPAPGAQGHDDTGGHATAAELRPSSKRARQGVVAGRDGCGADGRHTGQQAREGREAAGAERPARQEHAVEVVAAGAAPEQERQQEDYEESFGCLDFSANWSNGQAEESMDPSTEVGSPAPLAVKPQPAAQQRAAAASRAPAQLPRGCGASGREAEGMGGTGPWTAQLPRGQQAAEQAQAGHGCTGDNMVQLLAKRLAGGRQRQGQQPSPGAQQSPPAASHPPGQAPVATLVGAGDAQSLQLPRRGRLQQPPQQQLQLQALTPPVQQQQQQEQQERGVEQREAAPQGRQLRLFRSSTPVQQFGSSEQQLTQQGGPPTSGSKAAASQNPGGNFAPGNAAPASMPGAQGHDTTGGHATAAEQCLSSKRARQGAAGSGSSRADGRHTGQQAREGREAAGAERPAQQEHAVEVVAAGAAPVPGGRQQGQLQQRCEEEADGGGCLDGAQARPVRSHVTCQPGARDAAGTSNGAAGFVGAMPANLQDPDSISPTPGDGAPQPPAVPPYPLGVPADNESPHSKSQGPLPVNPGATPLRVASGLVIPDALWDPDDDSADNVNESPQPKSHGPPCFIPKDPGALWDPDDESWDDSSQQGSAGEAAVGEAAARSLGLGGLGAMAAPGHGGVVQRRAAPVKPGGSGGSPRGAQPDVQERLMPSEQRSLHTQPAMSSSLGGRSPSAAGAGAAEEEAQLAGVLDRVGHHWLGRGQGPSSPGVGAGDKGASAYNATADAAHREAPDSNALYLEVSHALENVGAFLDGMGVELEAGDAPLGIREAMGQPSALDPGPQQQQQPLTAGHEVPEGQSPAVVGAVGTAAAGKPAVMQLPVGSEPGGLQAVTAAHTQQGVSGSKGAGPSKRTPQHFSSGLPTLAEPAVRAPVLGAPAGPGIDAATPAIATAGPGPAPTAAAPAAINWCTTCRQAIAVLAYGMPEFRDSHTWKGIMTQELQQTLAPGLVAVGRCSDCRIMAGCSPQADFYQLRQSINDYLLPLAELVVLPPAQKRTYAGPRVATKDPLFEALLWEVARQSMRSSVAKWR